VNYGYYTHAVRKENQKNDLKIYPEDEIRGKAKPRLKNASATF
jgi:hypothetical protein